LIVNEVGSQVVSGKMITGLLALVETVPDKLPTGWNYILVGIQEGLTAQQKLTGPETVAGPVPAPTNGDGFTLGETSFVMQTPSASTNWTIYLVSGIGTKYNNIVPGQTPSCPLVLDAGGSGVLSAIDMLDSTLATELGVLSGGLFGITPGGVTSAKLATGAAQTNLGVVNASSILVSGSIVGSLLASTSLITLSAQIGTAVIASASIISLGVNQLTAGTATFTSTATFEYGVGGPSVVIASVGIQIINGGNSVVATSSAVTITTSSASLSLSTDIVLTAGSYTATIQSSEILLSNGTTSLGLTSTGMLISSGSNYLTLTASELLLSYGGAGTSFYPNVAVLSSSVYLSASANNYVEVTASGISLYSNGNLTVKIDNSGTATFTSGTQTTITGETVTAGILVTNTATIIGILQLSYGSFTSASAGSASALPALPAGYVYIAVDGTDQKFAYYN
jgi:hypothetical protein